MVSELTRNMRKQKSALTRAKNSGDPHKVIAACDAALDSFERYGWPDGWSLWQRARDDATFDLGREGRYGGPMAF